MGRCRSPRDRALASRNTGLFYLASVTLCYDIGLSYRDDLDAAHARISNLESELAKTERLLEESEERRSSSKKKPVAAKAKRPLRRLGKIYYSPPKTYAPLMALFPRVVRLAYESRVSGPPAPTSNSLFMWIGYYLVAWPLVLLYMPLYLAVFVALLIPYLAVLTVVLTVLLFPVVVLSRIRIDSGAPILRPESGALQEHTTDETLGVLLFMLSMAPPNPLIIVSLPVFMKSM